MEQQNLLNVMFVFKDGAKCHFFCDEVYFMFDKFCILCESDIGAQNIKFKTMFTAAKIQRENNKLFIDPAQIHYFSITAT